MAKKEVKSKKEMRVKDPDKYDYAYLLYIQNYPQKTICERVGISAVTLIKWKEHGEWETKRAAKAISTDVLVGKALAKINAMLDNEKDFSADAFAKAVSQLKNLKKDNTIDEVVEVLSRFGDWLISQCGTDKSIDIDFIRKVTTYQDKYIKERIGDGNK
jgi:hypothetical protein